MKTMKLTILSLALVAGVFSSCKKEKLGPAGPAGTNGTNGNTNVHSFTFSTTNSAWTQTMTSYFALLSIESINSNVLSTGSVNVFLGDGTGYNWTAMPVTISGIQCSYVVSLSTVKIEMIPGIYTTSPQINPGVQQFKVVIIDGSALKTHPTVNFNNYSELKKEFNLAD